MARIVVVGAGMAGLTAAFRLSQHDHDVTVLEARHRVGGRVHSVTLENGAVAELGGEWLTVGQRFVVGLAQELGVSMSPVGVDFTMRDLIGSPPIHAKEHRRVADLVLAEIAALPVGDMGQLTAARVLADLDDGSDAFGALRQRIAGSAGISLDLLAVGEIVGDFGVEDTTYLRIEGGNQALAEATASKVSDVRTGLPVSEIGFTEAGVRVQTDDTELHADGCVVGVPLPLISRIRFDPPLSPAMTDVLGTLAMGTAAKFAVSTESPPELVALQKATETWWCWTGAGADGVVREVVTAFAGTQNAIDALESSWRDQIQSALPNVELGPNAVMVDWGEDRWSHGCYTALAPGDRELLSVFSEPGRIVFAGEHTLGTGTIDGAIESGELAADRLASFLA